MFMNVHDLFPKGPCVPKHRISVDHKIHKCKPCEPCEPCGPPVGLGDKMGCALFSDRLRQLEVKLVSNETSKGINHAVNSIIEHRSGMDVRLGSNRWSIEEP